jgi:hypothetical protein
LLARPKRLLLPDPEIKATVRKAGKGFDVKLQAKKPALWCWLELPKIDASYADNFVDLAPGEATVIHVRPERAMKLTDFRKRLNVRSLVDTY